MLWDSQIKYCQQNILICIYRCKFKIYILHQCILETGDCTEHFILTLLFSPLPISLRSKQNEEKSLAKFYLCLCDFRYSNPKMHQTHNQTIVRKVQETTMYDPIRLIKSEYDFHNSLKSIFGYTLGKKDWGCICKRKGLQTPHSCWWTAGWISSRIQASAAHLTLLPLTKK